ncbi:MAG: GntP family permease [Firmicutes bacterium]|nr:GntP family permease [Bacillota bacterium]
MGLFGILLSLALLMFLAYRGLSIYVIAPICALVAAAFSGEALLPAYVNTYMKGAAGFVQSMFPVFLLGTIMGKLYEDSGGAKAIAGAIVKAFGSGRRLPAIAAIILAGGILGYGGVNVMVATFALFPLTLALFQELGMPRRFVPAVMISGLATFAMVGPGTPQVQNIIPATILKTPPTAGLIPGIVGCLMIFGMSLVYLDRAITTAMKGGEKYEPHPQDKIVTDQNLPSPWVALLPLVVVFCLLNVAKLNIVTSLVVGIILGFVLMKPYLRDIQSTINVGALGSAPAVLNTAAAVGFGAVIGTLPGFKAAVDIVTKLGGNPLMAAGISVTLIAGITGSASGGLGIALPILAPIFVGQMGVNPAAMHRVASFWSSGLDTLPHNGGVITMLNYTRCNHKESYVPMFWITVAFTLVASLVVTLLLVAFPSFA